MEGPERGEMMWKALSVGREDVEGPERGEMMWKALSGAR